MANIPARKVVAISTGDLRTAVRETKLMEEQSVVHSSDDLEFEKVKNLLISDFAKEEFKRAMRSLREIDIVGNLDLANLVAYCNSFSEYNDAIQVQKQPGFEAVGPDGKISPIIRVEREAYAQMAKAGDRCGMSIASRLKAGEGKVKKQQESIEDKFGVI